MEEAKKVRICWVDEINIMSAFKIVIINVFRQFTEIRYYTAKNTAKKILTKLCPKQLSFKNLVSSNQMISSREEMLIEHLSYDETTDIVYDDMDIESEVEGILPLLDERYDREKIVLYLRQAVSVQLEPIVMFLKAIKSSVEHGPELLEANNVVLVKGNNWMHYLSHRYVPESFLVMTYLNIKDLLNYFCIPLKVILEVIINSLLILLGKRIKKDDDPHLPKIAVFFVQGVDFRKKTDIFWFKDSHINPKQVLLYFKHFSSAPTKEVMDTIKGLGIKWVDLLPIKIGHKKITGGTIHLYKLYVKEFVWKLIKTFSGSMKILWACIIRRKKMFFWKTLLELSSNIVFFEEFFKCFNVKSHFALYEGGKDMMASNIAMDLVKGADISLHWSIYEVVNLQIGKPHDIYFSWGSYFRNNPFNMKYYQIKNFVIAGYPYDMFFDVTKQKALDYRENLKQKGAEFIISLSDQNLAPNRPLWNKNVIDIYTRLFRLVIDDPKIGLIIKPKKIDPQKKIPQLTDLIEQAIASGRCQILTPNCFPSEASLASDLSIGIGVASTATIEAMLAGVRSISYDPESFKEHPFYVRGHGNINFDDLDEMFDAINTCRKKIPTTKKFADYSFIIDELDPFRDHKASIRIGYYIEKLLGEFNKGLSKKEALFQANKLYAAAYGPDKITDGPPEYLKTIQPEKQAVSI